MEVFGRPLGSFLLWLQMKLLELHELVMRLVGERNDWYTKYMMATQSGEPQPGHEREAGAQADGVFESNASKVAGERQEIEEGKGFLLRGQPGKGPAVFPHIWTPVPPLPHPTSSLTRNSDEAGEFWELEVHTF